MFRINNPSGIYASTISILGTGVFLFVQQFHFLDSFGSTLSHAFLAAILLLGFFKVTIPTNGISFSLDSAIYLAILFLVGPNLALDILFLHSLIYLIWKNKLPWWKHIFNFASSTLIILLSYTIFIFWGGEVGAIQTSKLVPYILALSGYFSLYMFFTMIPFFFSKNTNWITVLKQFLEDKTFIIGYFTILLFSIVVGILIGKEGIFGLFLFVCIAMMLSIAYIEYFKLFQEVSNKAKIDFLTGLFNHGSFKELLEKAVLNAKKTNKPLSLALIDLDDFKKYNDFHGHLQGDHLLSTFGRLIDSFSTEKNFIAARYGGEEFAILMQGVNSQEAFLYLNQVRKKINDIHIEGVEVLPYGCLSFSAGIVELEKGTYSSSELLNKADKAMYLSKAQGKNMVEIYQEKLAKASLLLEEEIEKAEQKLAIFLAKDVQTYRHSKRVCQYAADFSKKLNFCDHMQQIFILGALVHDIGKLEISKDLLQKKEELDPHEWEIIKNHVLYGKEIISTIKEWDEVIPLVELHHERYDGKGYPYGLKGEEIPELARALCIIDSFDAMTSERPYQETKTFEEAIEELRDCSGKQFDPGFVEQFIQMIQEQKINRIEKDIAI